MVSIVIPSRAQQYLQQTIDDLLAKAEGKVEIIVVLDGYWPNPIIREDPRVVILHHGMIHDNVGMRGSINAGVDVAKGEYIMKIDEHCMVDQGYDVKLAADCENNWVVIPRRYRLDAENWKVIEDGRPPIDYMYLQNKDGYLHGSEWKRSERNSILIDDTMSFQGSCWFMKKKFWEVIGPMDDENYGPFANEAQEIGNKAWLSGGQVKVNKKTWYAHWHRDRTGYGFNHEQQKVFHESVAKGRNYSTDYWLNNKWPKRVHDFGWLLEKFWPVPTWPDNWQETYQKLLREQKV
ncbi:MAG: hypothetical protein A2653_00965 [Candidatus Zambryskibacteria bacterium RIFCSPHIGHO2_01_FULL_43_25]|nr:MAG: hypothetical protein A2653_00965 [Candidatus Zambryskibacteria bacterium RIFCSPHIGHO2_01_FULL_43_25]